MNNENSDDECEKSQVDESEASALSGHVDYFTRTRSPSKR